MATDPAPRRRIDGVIRISADSVTELGVHLLTLATELLTDEQVPESIDRSTTTEGATSRITVDVDEQVTAASFDADLLRWARRRSPGIVVYPSGDWEPF